MKPAPDMEPVRVYKSPCGGKYGVQRLVDYVPMWAKHPQTGKQRQVSARLGLLTQMKSKHGRLAVLTHTWLALDPAFLDAETTGLDAGAQALEIGLVDTRGEKIFKTHLRSTVAIDPAVAAIHGISDEGPVGASSRPDITQQLQHHIGRCPLVIFNAESDTRILERIAAAHSDPVNWLGSLTVYCAMRLAAGYHGPTNRRGTIPLPGAVSQAGLRWIGRAHSAVTDAVTTARVIDNIAGYWHELQCEMNDDAGSETA